MLEKQKENKGKKDFEAKQNAVGFFNVLLKVAKRNPELWEQICSEGDKDAQKSNYFKS